MFPEKRKKELADTDRCSWFLILRLRIIRAYRFGNLSKSKYVLSELPLLHDGTTQYRNISYKGWTIELCSCLHMCYMSMQINFLILPKSPNLRDSLEDTVSMSSCQFKLESKSTPRYLTKSFTGRNVLDIFKAGLLALTRRWLVPNTMTFVLEQLTIRPFSWNQQWLDLWNNFFPLYFKIKTIMRHELGFFKSLLSIFILFLFVSRCNVISTCAGALVAQRLGHQTWNQPSQVRLSMV